jgi:hypothetical protein
MQDSNEQKRCPSAVQAPCPGSLLITDLARLAAHRLGEAVQHRRSLRER